MSLSWLIWTYEGLFCKAGPQPAEDTADEGTTEEAAGFQALADLRACDEDDVDCVAQHDCKEATEVRSWLAARLALACATVLTSACSAHAVDCTLDIQEPRWLSHNVFGPFDRRDLTHHVHLARVISVTAAFDGKLEGEVAEEQPEQHRLNLEPC